VKAPRRIIDVGVSLSQESPAPPVHEDSPAPGALVVGQQHQVPTRPYKQVLIQIERLYTLLLEAEDDEKMLSALPTGAPLREQVVEDRSARRSCIANLLADSEKLADVLSVRKGRSMLLRVLPLLPEATATAVYSGLLTADTDNMYWPALARHIKQASMSSLATLASVLTHCEDTNHNSVRPTMASSIGATAIVTIIVKATLAARNGDLSEADLPLWREVVASVLAAVDSGAPVAKMLPPIQTLPSLADLLRTTEKQEKAWRVLQDKWIEPTENEN